MERQWSLMSSREALEERFRIWATHEKNSQALTLHEGGEIVGRVTNTGGIFVQGVWSMMAVIPGLSHRKQYYRP